MPNRRRNNRRGGAPTIFLPLRGQFDNIGDVMLRRVLLEWLEPIGAVHLYVGNAPEGFTRSLGPACDTVVYQSVIKWMCKAASSTINQRVWLFAKPGEVPATFSGLKEAFSLIVLAWLVRFRGGDNFRIGIGLRSDRRPFVDLLKPYMGMGKLAAWREPLAATAFKSGILAPDLAFAGTPPKDRRAPIAAEEGARPLLVVSLRSDRQQVSAEWLRALSDSAELHGLQVTFTAQVGRDITYNKQLADTMPASYVSWPEYPGGHDVHECRLRDLYGKAALVISDRLHVLVAAVTEGAGVLAAAGDANTKIARHFAAAGLTLPTVSLRPDGTWLFTQAIAGSLKSSGMNQAELMAAQGDLERLRCEIVTAVDPN